MLRQQIQDQMKQAMRDKDQIRLAAIRYLWSEVRNAEIDAKGELDDSAIQSLVIKEVKKRKDGITQFEDAGRDVEEEKAKLAILEEFLPQMMSREEVEKITDEVIDSADDKDFGKIMGQVMGKAKAAGTVDGSLVQEVVKAKLQ